MPEKNALKVGINQFRAEEIDLNTIRFSNKIQKTKRGYYDDDTQPASVECFRCVDGDGNRLGK